ncbi:hypothetical protein Pfo_018379 [Paulownia fortunei]|nr:hypothetical protein Pfo_018379 [Paulownia fortunei]
MEYCRKTNRRSRFKEWRFPVSLTIFFCICVYATYTTCNNPETLSETTCLLTLKDDNNCFKNSERNKIWEMAEGGTRGMGGARRLLGGLGSSPPRCSSKCGRCTPCKPVHVPVPPGTPVTTEYYPEAWRCKCGNKLYMP